MARKGHIPIWTVTRIWVHSYYLYLVILVSWCHCSEDFSILFVVLIICACWLTVFELLIALILNRILAFSHSFVHEAYPAVIVHFSGGKSPKVLSYSGAFLQLNNFRYGCSHNENYLVVKYCCIWRYFFRKNTHDFTPLILLVKKINRLHF